MKIVLDSLTMRQGRQGESFLYSPPGPDQTCGCDKVTIALTIAATARGIKVDKERMKKYLESRGYLNTQVRFVVGTGTKRRVWCDRVNKQYLLINTPSEAP